jgi:chemotaxis protein MotB
MAGKGGGAWKVAYADFVTAMMAFFLVMWITAQSKEVKKAIAEYFRDPYMATSAIPGEKAGSGRRGDSWNMKPARHPGRGRGLDRGPNPSIGDGEEDERTRASLLVLHDGISPNDGSVLAFAEDSAELNEKARQRLKRLVPKLLGKSNKIEIRGHASQRPLPPDSPYRDAWQISFARCLTIKKYLEQEGGEPARIRLSQAGVFEPLTLRAEMEKQVHNSRVEVYLLGELTEDLAGTPEERAQRFRSP